MLIRLPHIKPIETEDIQPDFEEQVKLSFSKFTQGTRKEYAYQDKLYYIDRLTREWIRNLEDARAQVKKLVNDRIEYALEEGEELPTREDLSDISFMEQCFEAGRDKSKLYQHYLDGSCSSADDRALKAEADIIKIVMNWEADDGEVH